ncbi:hypothetical protein [Rickettsiella massiliensis]|uniref:hypothetical protein n=1 Tax=Rickettsiella massiliensis TaxID=676517 RepID=UPI001F3816AD|nr:hypothetical protein [Rickettsiella massiliensis]
MHWYKLFCSAYPAHAFFTQILTIIHSTFESLRIDPTPEQQFYTEFDNITSLFYPNLTSQ